MTREFQFLPIATVTVADDGRATLEIDWSGPVEGEFLPDAAGPASDHVVNDATEVVCEFLQQDMLPGTTPIALGRLDPALLAANPVPCQCGHGPSRHWHARDAANTACQVWNCQCGALTQCASA